MLTVYALFGDDFRMAATHKRTDVLFDVLTIFCILIFAIEIIAKCLGEDGYSLGFFFMIDFVSTITLFMDLSWIADLLFCSGLGDGSQMRTARAGRAGARAGRTVRVIRLVRLVKLYKTYTTAMEQKERMKRRRNSGDARASTTSEVPGDAIDFGDDEDNLEEDEDLQDDAVDVLKKETAADGADKKKDKRDKKSNVETRVGKKLSDMTTRRVIILVLVMLFAMPQFLPSSYSYTDFRSSAYIGMEMIYERWRQWCPVDPVDPFTVPWCLRSPWDTGYLDKTLAESKALDRWWYEYYMLTYVYSHIGDAYAWKLHWVGLNSSSLVNTIMAERSLSRQEARGMAWQHLQMISQLGQEKFLKGHPLPSSTWNEKFSNVNWQIPVDTLPDNIRTQLAGTWSEQCDNDEKDFIGVPLVPLLDGKDPTDCSVEEDLRCSEYEYFVPLALTIWEESHIKMLFAFDKRRTTQLEAALSMLQTVFICIAVGVGAMTFSNDANQLLLNPIERMMQKMETIKDNPLEAMRLGDFEFRREEIEAAKRREALARKSGLQKLLFRVSGSKKVKEPMETVILEKTIIKLGGLLALGFGEAGAEIIGQNMQGGHSAGVNAMVPGQKVDAIIGFCNIRHFADATEVLKEKVMIFVNRIGEIVHGCVDDYHGAPNKNIGDAFLLVWRLSGVSLERQTKMADMAIMSFIRIIAAVNKSPVLADYRGHPAMLQRVPNYRVLLGFGLHCGWAIEGAIGSEFKIDASYLSPNVNVASRLEAATEQFNVWVLISHFMINLCSSDMGALCRLIDHVTVKGSKQPIRLYTIDVDYMQLEVQNKSMDRVIKNRFKVRQVREVRKNEKWAEDHGVSEAFLVDEDLVIMRRLFSSEFFQRFAMAYRNYEAGEWMVARDMLFTCHYQPTSSVGSGAACMVVEDEWPADGPTATLLKFMRQDNYIAPLDWPGHRVLANK
jgi:class 3 adenylate cyclase